MAETVWVGVDGGGSHCHVVLQNTHGEIIGHGYGGPSNIRLSVSNTWTSIRTAFDDACRTAHIDPHDTGYVFHAGMGLAGTEVKQAVRDFQDTPHLFKTLLVESDAHTACLGAHCGNDGAIIIAGTGVIGYCIQQSQVLRVGGWGFPQGDEGGGAWLGLEVMRAMLHMLDGRRATSPLLQKLFARFDHNITALNHWVNHAKSSEFAQLAPLVIDYLSRGDSVAIELITHAAQHITAVATALHHRSGRAELPYCLLGGIAPFIQPYLTEEWHARLVTPRYDAAIGGIFLIKQHIKGVEFA